MDIQQIPFPDNEFDIIFCNHILEHVEDDRLAMREMFRVMRPGGWGVMLSPVNMEREVTYEDPLITDPDERERCFGQKDHLRDYGRDYGKRLAEAGFEVAIVIGGGNIFRGIQGLGKGVDRVKGDQMGMLATVINSLALQSALASEGVRAKVLTSICMEPIGEYYSKDKAVDYLQRGYVVIIGGGTSNPYFTTDSAAALRAVEIEANVLLKGTRVDGVYDADPEKHPEAVKFDTITFSEAYNRGLKIMDLTAFTLCRENGMPVIVFNMDIPGNLRKVVRGETVGTLVSEQ